MSDLDLGGQPTKPTQTATSAPPAGAGPCGWWSRPASSPRPARAGPNRIDLWLARPDGAAFAAKEVWLEMSRPGAGIAGLRRPMREAELNRRLRGSGRRRARRHSKQQPRTRAPPRAGGHTLTPAPGNVRE